MKALLATPLLSGTADREFITGLLQAHGLYAGWICLEGQANISRARDLLVSQFMATDCTTLVFIDGDMGFGHEDLRRLLASPYPITSGLCPRKNAKMTWACVPQPAQAPVPPEHPDFRRVRRAGTGFLRIDRGVLEAMIGGGHAAPYELNGKPVHQFFPSGLLDGEFLSEDYYFCELAARAGFGVHVDTAIKVRHVGRYVYQRTDIG